MIGRKIGVDIKKIPCVGYELLLCNKISDPTYKFEIAIMKEDNPERTNPYYFKMYE